MTDNLPALIDYSKTLATSDLLPDAYRGKPANVLVAIEYGRALALEPMAAIQGITVIKGKPTASASLIAGLVRRAGHILRVTGTEKRAEAVIIRADDPDYEFKSVWTIERATQAGLTGKGGSWKTYPAAMLKARAITEVARDACSEILAGVQYTPEELDEEPAAPVGTARRRTVVASKPTTSNVPVVEKAMPPEPDLDDDVVDAEIVEDGPVEPVEPVERPQPVEPEPPVDQATPAQLKAVHAALTGMGIKERDRGLGLLGGMIGRPITSTKELTRAEAHRIIDSLNEPDDPEEIDQ